MKQQLIKFIVLIAILISGCTSDLKTKEIINNQLREQSVAVIDNFLNFTYVENHAIAFGMFNGIDRDIRMPIIFILPVLVTLFGFYLIWRLRKSKFRLLLPIFIILGGAYGNIIDRAMNGYVTDFLHVHYHLQYNFYVFNLADVLVNIGLILILFQYKEFNKLLDDTFGKKASVSNK